MGQDLTYEAADVTYEYRISRADWELIQSLRQHLPKEIDALYEVPALGEPVRVATVVLRSAADTVLAFAESNKHLLPYTYQFKPETLGDPRITPGFGTGGLSGIRLPEDANHYYFIRAGLNECRLEKSAVGPDGRGYKVSERDLRGERELMTANLGRIAIRRTRARTDLLKGLPEIQAFLRSVTSSEVVKTVG